MFPSLGGPFVVVVVIFIVSALYDFVVIILLPHCLFHRMIMILVFITDLKKEEGSGFNLCFSLQIWKVESQEIIATYNSHLGPVQCCMWSPFSQDLMITGSTDFTVRIWTVSDQKVIAAAAATKTPTRGKRTKKKKAQEGETVPSNASNGVTTESKIANGEPKDAVEDKKVITSTIEFLLEIDDTTRSASKVTARKRKPKKTTHFPGYAELTRDNKLWCSSVRKLLNTARDENKLCDESGVVESNGVEKIENGEGETATADEKIPVLLGSKKDLRFALNYESKLYSCESLQKMFMSNDIII